MAQSLGDFLRAHEAELLAAWTTAQLKSSTMRRDLISDSDLHRQSREFLAALARAADGSGADVSGEPWDPVKEVLQRLTSARASQGFSPTETAQFVLSLKQALFKALRSHVPDVEQFGEIAWSADAMLDSLGLYTLELHQKRREQIIVRQQQEMMELSTPVVTLWHGVLALPLIGTLDSARTQVIMENLLQRIVDTGSAIAILDITGVPTVDTLVAQHLLKTVAAARLMGADCIISGIRPQIAQTIVHLGVDLNTVTTKATLADAFAVALKRAGLTVVRAADAAAPPRADAVQS